MAAALLVPVKGAGARRGIHVQPRHRPQSRPRCGLRRAEQGFVHPEIAGEDAPVRFGQPARRAALDELLDVGGIAADQPGQPGIILAPFLDEARQRRPAIHLGHDFHIVIGFFLDK